MPYKHTPGDWKLTLDERIETTFPVDYNGHLTTPENVYGWRTIQICKLDVRLGSCSLTEEQQANAKLITAAPDLLKSLSELVSYLGEDWENDDFVISAKEAIKKATI